MLKIFQSCLRRYPFSTEKLLTFGMYHVLFIIWYQFGPNPNNYKKDFILKNFISTITNLLYRWKVGCKISSLSIFLWPQGFLIFILVTSECEKLSQSWSLGIFREAIQNLNRVQLTTLSVVPRFNLLHVKFGKIWQYICKIMEN